MSLNSTVFCTTFWYKEGDSSSNHGNNTYGNTSAIVPGFVSVGQQSIDLNFRWQPDLVIMCSWNDWVDETYNSKVDGNSQDRTTAVVVLLAHSLNFSVHPCKGDDRLCNVLIGLRITVWIESSR